MRIRSQYILYLINISTAVVFLIIALLPNNILRVIFGLPVVLFFPGYTLLSALFPRTGGLQGIERFALSFAMSLAIVPLIGLGLNITPWGIRLYPILISLSVFIFTMSIIAWLRGRRLATEEAVSIQIEFKFPALPNIWAGQSLKDKIITIGLVMMIIGAIGTLGYVAALPRTPEKFTEFYVLDSGGKAENYPSIITLGQSGTVILGIINREYEITDYRIEIKIDGVNSGEIADISLNSEDKWEQAVTFTPTYTGENQKIEFLLYKSTATDVYQRVHLWIGVK